MDVIAIGLRATAVLNHVDFEETRWRVAPVGKRAHRNTAPDRCADAGSAPAFPVNLFTRSAQGAVNGGRAHTQQLVFERAIQAEMAMALHGTHQHGYQRLETLAAQPVSGFP